LRLKRRVVASGIVTAFLVIAIFCARPILWRLGAMQVNVSAPCKADIIVVLGGDFNGNRILKAAELAREGYAPRVLVSGSGSVYGLHESVLEVDFAVRHGYPREIFISFPYPAVSTLDEATHVVPELRKLGIRKYLIVTSPNHSARAGAIFRKVAPDLEPQMVASNDPLWEHGDWWTHREGQKLWFMEEIKTITAVFGL
jgi:uncharacterized SAM-binding protein YcdF (DUF218 family)